MRYQCPSCARVFFLDMQAQSPCPACGAMLEAREEGEAEGPAPAGPGPGTAQPSAQAPGAAAAPSAADWLSDLAGDSLAPPPPAAPPPPPAPPPPTPAAAPPPPQVDEYAGAPEEEQVAAWPERPAPVSERLAVPRAKGPSLTFIFLVTGTVMIGVGAIATAVILSLPRLTTTPVGPKPTAATSAELAAALTDIERVKEELARFKEGARAAKDAMEQRNEKLETEKRRIEERLHRRATAVPLLVGAVEMLERRSDPLRALSLAEAAFGVDPELFEAQRVQGRILAALGRFEEALAALERSDKGQKDAGRLGDEKALVLAGELCLTQLQDESRAGEFYKRASSVMDEPGPLGRVAEARLALLDGREGEAASLAEAAGKEAPADPLSYLVLGEVALSRAQAAPVKVQKKKFLAEAVRHLDKAVKLDPSSPRGNLMRGRAALIEAELGAAESRFMFTRVTTLGKAKGYLSRAAALAPTWPVAKRALAEARLLERTEKGYSKALDLAGEAARLTRRKDAESLRVLAAAQHATGDAASAASTLKEALALDPKNADELRGILKKYEQEGLRRP